MQLFNFSKAEGKWFGWKIYHAVSYLVTLYLLVAILCLINYEEMEMGIMLVVLLSSIPVLLLWRMPFTAVKIDMGRRAILYKRFLGRVRELGFDSITRYTKYNSYDAINVYTNNVGDTVTVKNQPGYDELLEWLTEEKPAVEAGCRNLRWGRKDFLWIALFVFVPISVKKYERELDGFTRSLFPFKAGETVEVSGTFLKSHRRQRSRDYGPYGFMSFELKEYPGIRFNASTHLPDEVFLMKEGKSLVDSVVYLTVSQSDMERIHRHFLLFGKESVRTYEVRTGHEKLLKKDIGPQDAVRAGFE